MKSTQKTLFILLLIFTTANAFAQITAVRRYNPTGKTAATQRYSASTVTVENLTPTSRRAAAVSKVQQPIARSFTAKGLEPALYSTIGPSPTQYSTDGPSQTQYSTKPNPSTTFTVNGANVQRKVRKGEGQVGNLLFRPITEMHYVQFAVYCKNTPVDKAPPIEGLMLLWHEGSKCPGGEEGACYIVKGYDTAEDAKEAVLRHKANHIDCWYNPALTGAAVEVIGVRA